MMRLGDMWRLMTGEARHEAERQNEEAYYTLERRMSECDSLDEIDRMMRERRGSGHDKPTSR